ncbi:MAG: stage V sporulation protein AD [Firmicutes bacterium]|nr:stage V sporulation protein AD [Bacillota bacterium]
MSNRLGSQTLTFSRRPRVLSSYTLVGPIEGKGPHALDFDEILPDDVLGQKTPEKTERLMLEMAVEKTLRHRNTKSEEVHFILAGDLLNQITSSSFAASTYTIPFLGIYGACSTFAQGIGLGAALLQGDFAEKVLIGTASHYQTAERQFRYPIELNVQHISSNHHTVTGAGAALLGFGDEGPQISYATFGHIVDMGLKDAHDMGSAMAPAAYSTIKMHLQDTGRSLEDYDMILTGDLGKQGRKMLRLLLEKDGLKGLERLQDGGSQIYSEGQKAGAGGSGAACIAVMALGYGLNMLKSAKAERILIVATGALLSALTVLQGETIPCVAHAIAFEA